MNFRAILREVLRLRGIAPRKRKVRRRRRENLTPRVRRSKLKISTLQSQWIYRYDNVGIVGGGRMAFRIAGDIGGEVPRATLNPAVGATAVSRK